MQLFWFLLVGLIAGWLAESLMRSQGCGMVVSIIHGVLGAIIGGYVFSHFGLMSGGGLGGRILVATCGAAILIFALRVIRKI